MENINKRNVLKIRYEMLKFESKILLLNSYKKRVDFIESYGIDNTSTDDLKWLMKRNISLSALQLCIHADMLNIYIGLVKQSKRGTSKIKHSSLRRIHVANPKLKNMFKSSLEMISEVD